jgi:hypothetical protein
MTWLDILGCLRCVASFALLLLAPGYCLAWASNLLGFRRRPTREQLAWAVALSFAVAPIVSVMLGKYASLSVVCWLAALCGATSIALAATNLQSQRENATATRARTDTRTASPLALAIAAAWILFVILELVDVAIGPHLYLSVTVFDHALRTAFVDSVLRTGVPPANPLFWPGHAAPMRYYYFWYVLTAAAARLAAATPRQAIIASVVWAGFGLAAILALFCRHFLTQPDPNSPAGSRNSRLAPRASRLTIALALLAVTGLDILPAIAKALLRLPTDADMDWWSFAQVTSWIDSLLWVPHHIAGLICCLLGFLLIWISKARTPTQRLLCALLAGLAFASALGLSTWVAFAFALVMIAWLASILAWEPASRPRIPILLAAGLIAALTLLPYLNELRQTPSGISTALSHGTNGSDSTTTPAPPATPATQTIATNHLQLLTFGVRHIIDPDALLALPGFPSLARSHPQLEDALAGLILLLPGYFVELGFYGLLLVVAVRTARRHALDEPDRTALTLTCAALLVATFLRSTVVVNNDFGMRSILVAQFFLLLLAVRWCEGALAAPARPLRAVMLAMLWIGLAGTIYQALILRLYLPVEDHLGRPTVAGLSQQAMALRRGFDQMDRLIPPNAVVQFDTAQPSDYFRFAQIMQSHHQIAAALPDCPAVFGGDASACAGVEDGVTRLFSPSTTAAQARALCSSLGINYLIATDRDPVWPHPQNWVWTLPATLESNELRVLDCAAPAP